MKTSVPPVKMSAALTSGMPTSRVSRPALSASQMSQRVVGFGRPARAAAKTGISPKMISVSVPRVMRCTLSQRKPLNHGSTLKLESDESSAANTASETYSRVIRKYGLVIIISLQA